MIFSGTKSNGISSNELNYDKQNNLIHDEYYDEPNLNNASMEMEAPLYESEKYIKHGDDNTDKIYRCHLAKEILNIINDCTEPLCDDYYCKKSVSYMHELNSNGYLERVKDAMAEILNSDECKDTQEEEIETHTNIDSKKRTIQAKRNKTNGKFVCILGKITSYIDIMFNNFLTDSKPAFCTR